MKNEGDEWKEFGSGGTSIGNKRIIVVDMKTVVTGARLNVTNSISTPQISKFAIFDGKNC